MESAFQKTAQERGICGKGTEADRSAEPELYLIMPRGNKFGWGICGKYLAKELSQRTRVRYVTEPFTVADIGDDLDYRILKDLLASEEEIASLQASEDAIACKKPVLQAIRGKDLQPWGRRVKARKKVGYTFFEDNILLDKWISNAVEYFDMIVTGSKWCENVLKSYGLESVTTAIQGIDPQVFNPYCSDKEYFKDYFVIFSGGKFELRKGQDLVIKAYKVMQDRHPDVMLVNSWFNMWTESFNTMTVSPYIKLEPASGDYVAVMNEILKCNGIDLKRVITMAPGPQATMAKVYKNTDVGLFPNRCEGGTNLVLMEYMACGKPAIASYHSGHKDILTRGNAAMIENIKPWKVSMNGTVIAEWGDPDLEEIVSHLEWAYEHRDDLEAVGTQAGKDMQKYTWGRTAEQFLRIMGGTVQ